MCMQKRSNVDPKFICAAISYLLFDHDENWVRLSWNLSVRMPMHDESKTLHRPPEGPRREQLAMKT